IGRITRGDAFHALPCVMVAIGAGLGRGAGLLVPQGFAIEHAQHARIDRVLILHRLKIAPHERIARPPLGSGDFGGERGNGDAGRDQQRGEDYRRSKSHSTVMAAEAVAEKPLSPIHSKSNFPLLLATVKNEMKGLAAVAGKKSARKISSPSKRHVKLVMMSRGITTPLVVWR